MIHLGARAFEDIGGEVVQTTSFIMKYDASDKEINEEKGVYFRLIGFNEATIKQ